MVTFVNECDALTAVDGFTSSWLARDIERQAIFLTEDFTLWNSCNKMELQKSEAIRYLYWLSTVRWNNEYCDVRRHLSPAGVVQQHLAAYETADGKFRDIPMLLIFTTWGAKVARCEEYLDSTGLPKLEWPERLKFS